MIKAVLLVSLITALVVLIVIVVDYFNRIDDIKSKEQDLSRYDYDPEKGVYFDPREFDRTEKDGVVSFKSRKKE